MHDCISVLKGTAQGTSNRNSPAKIYETYHKIRMHIIRPGDKILIK